MTRERDRRQGKPRARPAARRQAGAPRTRRPRPDLAPWDLYERAVQAPALQARFLEALHGGGPRLLAEDFCGPGSLARAWVARGPERRAVATDLDLAALAHGRARLAPELAGRVTWRQGDARRSDDPAQVVAAFNFALCELHARTDLLAYLRRARARLERGGPGGLLAADLYGGPDAWQPLEREEELDLAPGRLLYRWEQRRVDPIAGRVVNAIHFELPGGRLLRDAFVYDWRLWSVPELRDALLEAGFARVEVHASYGDAVEADGRLHVAPLTPEEAAEELGLEEGWVVYVVARV